MKINTCTIHAFSLDTTYSTLENVSFPLTRLRSQNAIKTSQAPAYVESLGRFILECPNYSQILCRVHRALLREMHPGCIPFGQMHLWYVPEGAFRKGSMHPTILYIIYEERGKPYDVSPNPQDLGSVGL